jgi:hypothetical protein
VADLGPPVVPDAVDRPHNFAVNNGREFPMATASFSAPTTPPFYAVDGNIWYHAEPPNRWTTLGSNNPTDWFEIAFGVERPVESLALYFIEEGDSLAPPAQYEVEVWAEDGWVEWTGRRSPAQPTARRANRVHGDPVRTSRLRVRLTHQDGRATGVSELEVWGHAPLPLTPPSMPSPNLAHGAALNASFTSPADDLQHLTDMQIAFTRYSRNRWSARDSPNAADWVELTLDSATTVSVIDIYFYGDRGLAAPAAFDIEVWDGSAWGPASERSRVPAEPTAWAMNRVELVPVETDRVRIRFEHALPDYSAVTEVMMWGATVSTHLGAE